MTERKQKLLFIIPSLEEGGAERVLLNLLKRFDYSRFSIDLCVVEKRGIYFEEIPSQVKVITLFSSEFVCRVFNGLHVRFNFNFVYRRLANWKIRGRYDVGISFLDSGYTDILFFLKTRVFRRIGWVHSSYQTYRNFEKFYTGAYKKRVIENRYSKLDTIVFVSNDSKKEFGEIFGQFRSMRVIYNLIDARDVIAKSAVPLPEPFKNDVINIVALGVLLPVKGYDKLIRAAKMLKDDNMPFKIRILGNGTLEEELHAQIKELSLENEVELMGFHYNPFPFLRQSDIFVMTSVSEGLPTALCEAMILGLPTLVTDCSGCREIVGSGQFGMMVQQSEVSIYQGLKDMITTIEKRDYFQRKSLERATIFNDDAILEQVYDLLEFKPTIK